MLRAVVFTNGKTDGISYFGLAKTKQNGLRKTVLTSE